MPTYRDNGIILQKYNIGEADVLVTMLTRDGGLVRLAANGARRQSSRKRGHLELFNQVRCLMAEGRNLDTLVEAESLDIFDRWRSDLGRISLAYYAADLTLHFLPEGEPQPVIYDQLVQYLAWLGHAQHASVLTRWYEVQLLQHLGYWAGGQLDSQSQNAVVVLEQFGNSTADQAATLKVASALDYEMERLMQQRCGMILDREVRSQGFVDRVRELG